MGYTVNILTNYLNTLIFVLWLKLVCYSQFLFEVKKKLVYNFECDVGFYNSIKVSVKSLLEQCFFQY